MEQKYDVLLAGAGPVGLLMTYQLERLGVSTCIIDSADKASPDFPMYGRASTLFPRSLEMLDQLDLFDDMAQVGFVARRNINYGDGKRIKNRNLTARNTNMQGTFFDFWLNIRLKYSEDIYREKVKQLGSKVQAPVKLVDLQLAEDASDDYRVTATVARPDGTSFKIRSKYIVGCDGASSAVRSLAKIPFDGATQEDHWVRIDGMVRTNLPDARAGVGTVESKTHGQVLWVALDHGATRIGYVLTPEMYAKYGKSMKQEDAIKEATAAMAPFEIEFDRVDWHTVYTVKQFVAQRFVDRDRILIAGDAAHAHSSGSAQGMNTGIHDSVSLAWRLAGVIKGMYKQEVLFNFSDERRASAQHLIENDKVVSALISGHKPDKFKGRPEDPMILFDEFLEKEWRFTLGLGINYPPNLLNDVQNSYPPIITIPGHPAPDARLHKQGLLRGFSTRLHEVTKYNGKFRVVVFTGEVTNTAPLLKKLRTQVDLEGPKYSHVLDFLTVVCGAGSALEEYLGVEQFGKGYWDIDNSAHELYQISFETGCMIVIRPDGILGYVAPLDGFDKVRAYLDRLIVPRELDVVTNGANGVVGEMITLDENNLYYKQSNAQDMPQSHEQGIVSPHSA